MSKAKRQAKKCGMCRQSGHDRRACPINEVVDINTYEVKQLRESVKWRKVKGPKVWRPTEPGEELVGYYGGRTTKDGSFGQYDVIMIHVPRQGSDTVSGTQVIQRIDGARVTDGDPVRVTFQGRKEFGKDNAKSMKLFDVYVEEKE